MKEMKELKELAPQVKAEVFEIIDKLDTVITNLKSRWLNEREYEDFKEYRKILENEFKKIGYDKVKITKSFKFTFIPKVDKSIQCDLTRTVSSYKWGFQRVANK